MKTPRKFYTELTSKGLAKRKSEIDTKKELIDLKKKLNKNKTILDLGCGYGRLTIPLAKEGYKIEGIDITPSFIKQAIKNAKKLKLDIKFRIGDIRKLPHKKESFDIVICMWSVFLELTKINDQISALKEISRILNHNGLAIIEMAPSKKFYVIKDDEIGDLRKLNEKTRLVTGKISGITAMPHYFHNNKTLKSILTKAKIKNFKINEELFGGRNRLILQFWKG